MAADEEKTEAQRRIHIIQATGTRWVGAALKRTGWSPEAKAALEMVVGDITKHIVDKNMPYLIKMFSSIMGNNGRKAPAVMSTGMTRVMRDENGEPELKFNFGDMKMMISSLVGFLITHAPNIMGGRKQARRIYRSMDAIGILANQVLYANSPWMQYADMISTPARKILAMYKANPALLTAQLNDAPAPDGGDDSDSDDDRPVVVELPPQPKPRKQATSIPVRPVEEEESLAPPPPPPASDGSDGMMRAVPGRQAAVSKRRRFE